MKQRRDYSGVSEQGKASLHRRVDAEVLRDHQRWRGAMYMLGYAVECLLKAKLMERFGASTLSELERILAARQRRKLRLQTHSLGELMEYTGAESRLAVQQRREWGLVRKWTVEWRYSPDLASEHACAEFFTACTHVIQFIKSSV